MKRPLFNSNAQIGLQETPARVQRHEIVSRIKKKKKCKARQTFSRVLVDHASKYLRLFSSVHVCVHVEQPA